MSPPCSPDLMLDRGFRDLKDIKEPSPKVKRRRSVKISNVALEPAQWQNDAMQILTSINDYRSMNDFLMKKVEANVIRLMITLYLRGAFQNCKFPTRRVAPDDDILYTSSLK